MNFTFEFTSEHQLTIIMLSLLAFFFISSPVQAHSSIDYKKERQIYDFLNNLHRDMSENNQQAVAKYYASYVRWFNKGMVPKSKIMREKRAIAKKYFARSYRIWRIVSMSYISANEYRIKYITRHKVAGRNGRKCGHWSSDIVIKFNNSNDIRIVAQDGSAHSISCELADEKAREAAKNGPVAAPILPDLACAVLIKNFREDGCHIYVDDACRSTCNWVVSRSNCSRKSNIVKLCRK